MLPGSPRLFRTQSMQWNRRLAISLAVLAWVWGASAASAPAQHKGARRLAPGVVTVIPTAPDEGETFTGPLVLKDVVGKDPKLDWSPVYSPKSGTYEEQAKRVILRRDIWYLEFAFKPLRMIDVDIPQPSGKMQRKQIWYMAYRVKNNGSHLNPVSKEDKFGHKTYGTEAFNKDLRFFPHFVLETKDLDRSKAYLDRIIPAAVEPIQRREDPNIMLLNTVEISKATIPVSDAKHDRSVWGVVTWEDIDPRVDYFAIYIQGLTNAFHFEEAVAGQKKYAYKTLQLNFWRPNDGRNESEDAIHYGVRLVTDEGEQKTIFSRYRVEKPLDYVWLYR